MNSDERLIERAAEVRANNSMSNVNNSNEESVVGFDIDYNKGNIRYRNLDDERHMLFKLDELKDIDLSRTFEEYNLILTDEALSEIKKLQRKLQNSWINELESYELSYRVNEDGSSELYIPLRTEFTSDYIVQKIYNEDGDFVAENIEQDIEYPIYNIETKKLYIDNIIKSSRIKVYEKEQKSIDTIVHEKTPSNNLNELRSDLLISTITTVLLYSFLTIIYINFGIYYLLIMFVVLCLVGLPFVLPMISIGCIYHYISIYRQDKYSEDHKLVKSFIAQPEI